MDIFFFLMLTFIKIRYVHFLRSHIVLQDLKQKTSGTPSPFHPFPFLISHSPAATTFSCSQEPVVDPPWQAGDRQGLSIRAAALLCSQKIPGLRGPYPSQPQACPFSPSPQQWGEG